MSKKSPEQRQRLITFLIQSCYLVVVAASDQESAYRIFAVMNDRGLDLSPTDILKANIIGALSEDKIHADNGENLRDFYTAKWETIEEQIGRDEFRDLFGHIRTVYARNKPREALNKEFRAAVMAHVDERDFVDDVLEPMADAYTIISRANYVSEHDSQDVNRYLEHLNRLDNADWIPPALRFFERHKTDHGALAGFVRDLERLAYVMFVNRADVNERIRRYGEITAAIDAKQDLSAKSSPLQLRPGEASRAKAAIDGPVYENPRVRMPLALRVDALVADDGATYDHKVVSLEHVLPQTPDDSSQWVVVFPDEEERTRWAHRLANLVLLSRRKNSQAQNYDFERKKHKYFARKGTTPFALTAQVLHENAWTPKVLERRQKTLISALVEEWHLDEDDDGKGVPA